MGSFNTGGSVRGMKHFAYNCIEILVKADYLTSGKAVPALLWYNYHITCNLSCRVPVRYSTCSCSAQVLSRA